MTRLELRHIKKAYKLGRETFPVLKGIDLSFDNGDFTSILGESGGGKSTLMNIIGGLDRDYQGDVILNGKKQKDKKEKAMDTYRRDTIGFIFQSFNLVNYLTVLDNVLLSLKMTQLSQHDRKKRAEELLRQVGLYDHRKKKPAQLSGGQKQRVAIARALANDPDIIIADEPTGALDSQNTKEVLAILQDIAASGKTVIVVTHSQDVADSGSRIVRLVDGKITEDKRIRPAFSDKEPEKGYKSRSLSYMSSWKMAFSHFKSAWKQNLIITIGTAIGLFSVMFFLGLGNGANKYMNHFIDGIANPKAIQVSLKDTAKAASQGITADNYKQLKNIKHVQKVNYGYYAPIFNLSYKNKRIQSQILQTSNDTILKKSLSNKKFPKDNEIILSKANAKSFVGKKTKKIIGQKVTLALSIANGQQAPTLVSKTYTVVGTTEGSNIVSYTGLTSAAKAANAKLKPNFVTLTIDDLNNTKQVQNKVKALKSNHKTLYSIEGIGGILDNIVQIVYIVSFVLALVAGISLLVSILMIIATTYMSVAERTKEIGILRAMGARRKDIRRLFVNESLLLGISANLLAIMTVFLVQYGVNKLVYNTIKFDIIQVSATATLVTVLIGIIIALLASIAPAGKAARLNPIEALASE
ncbi:ATP-binding cassette domain-containing protein [Streptococcus macacae]|uniref:Efflux ABC transporter, permease protein n=1 Tax=Streptococcus macacae NCTC 11558 TaxID=764298 RepID=G5JWZ4_9STRE|nr:ABC transporter ATP-binding protein/permease [Streptococcus macacae]EHJ53042.1 efflux ABC transporter, permease protein [Streptococcus macacae NCTC 11558]SUN79470.1 ABC transporter membrane protein subunit and ATP-binding protein [Streptococcus macacae NCTC 11558]